ncbi:MAG: hypothetical protein DSY70_02515 [Desulfobulbus sp.]|nr:MAG: hypothetical protein DSY70_02515 [Desulfobulbus sp.]
MYKCILTTLTMTIFFMAQLCQADSFTLTSPQLSEGSMLSLEQVFNGFGCAGKNISPELNWSGEPGNTKSFALTMYDPDAPTGSGWWHWVVFNIPTSVHSLALDSGNISKKLLPEGAVQSRTDFGTAGYGGSCPPEKDSAHRYVFTLWALDIETLPLNADATAAMVGFYLHQHQLGHTVLTAQYDR